MKLMGVEKTGNCLYSEWSLTFGVGWESICRAARLVYQYTEGPVLHAGDAGGDRVIDVADEDQILKLNEMGYLSVEGNSEVIKVPLKIVFYNQSDFVKLYVASANEEFEKADYQAFNLSMCQFMDSVEIGMYS